MIEPEWIEPDLAEIFHSEQLAEHGGREGIRDLGRLEAAMSRPRNLFALRLRTCFDSPRPMHTGSPQVIRS